MDDYERQVQLFGELQRRYGVERVPDFPWVVVLIALCFGVLPGVIIAIGHMYEKNTIIARNQQRGLLIAQSRGMRATSYEEVFATLLLEIDAQTGPGRGPAIRPVSTTAELDASGHPVPDSGVGRQIHQAVSELERREREKLSAPTRSPSRLAELLAAQFASAPTPDGGPPPTAQEIEGRETEYLKRLGEEWRQRTQAASASPSGAQPPPTAEEIERRKMEYLRRVSEGWRRQYGDPSKR